MSQDPLESSFSGDLPELTQSMDLVRRFQGGEDEALGQLLARYQDRLLRIARVRLGSRLRGQLESMDIVQGANLVVMRKLRELEVHDESSILRWLSQIVLHQIRDADKFFRAERRDVDRAKPLDPGSSDHRGPVELEDGAAPSPVGAAAERELREIIDEAMLELSEEHREVILRRDYERCDWAEIAVALGDFDKQSRERSSEERLRRAVHAAQERWRRAWMDLRRIVRGRMEDPDDSA